MSGDTLTGNDRRLSMLVLRDGTSPINSRSALSMSGLRIDGQDVYTRTDRSFGDEWEPDVEGI